MNTFYPENIRREFYLLRAGKSLLLLLFMSLLSIISFAATITSTTSGGNWEDPATWIGGEVPTTADDVVIAESAVVTVTSSNKTVASLFINDGGRLDMNTFSLTTTGNLDVDPGGILDMGTGMLSVGGTVTNNMGTVRTANISSTPLPTGRTWGGVVEYYAAAGGQTIVEGTYNNLEINHSAGGTSNAGGNLILNGNLVTNSVAIFNLGTNTLTGTFSASDSQGTIRTQRLITAFPGKTWGGTVVFDATSGNQEVQIGTYNNLSISGGDKTMLNGIIFIEGVFNPTATGTYSVSPQSTISFSGTGAQNIPAFPYHYLWIGVSELDNMNNPVILPTSGIKTLTGNITVSGELGLFRGIVNTNGNTFTMLSGSFMNTGAGSGSTTSYVDGAMIKQGAADFTFPLGRAGVFAPLGLDLNTGIAQTYTAEYFRGSAYALDGDIEPPLVQISSCEYWRLISDVGNTDEHRALITLSYSTASTCSGNVNYITNPASLRVAHLDNVGGNDVWRNASDATGGSGFPSGTVSTVISYSGDDDQVGYLTLGTVSAENALPVNFVSIKATRKEEGVLVNWVTASEEGLDVYEVQRSANGRDYVTVGKVKPTANNGSGAEYNFTDNNAPASALLYRIKALDIDGKFRYSTIAKVAAGREMYNLQIAPNPVIGRDLTVRSANLSAGQYTISVYDITGRAIYNQDIRHNGGLLNQAVSLPGNVQAGMYNLQIIGSNGVQIKKAFIIQ